MIVIGREGYVFMFKGNMGEKLKEYGATFGYLLMIPFIILLIISIFGSAISGGLLFPIAIFAALGVFISYIFGICLVGFGEIIHNSKIQTEYLFDIKKSLENNTPPIPDKKEV